MFRAFPSRFRVPLAALAVAAITPCAHALEHITLTSGFTLDCAHHEVFGQRMRLYTDSGDTQYQEIAAAQVSAIETLPDPPPPPPVAAIIPPPAKPTSALPTIAEVREMLTRAGSEHNIDVELLASVVKTESNFQANAISRAGARGLMQLMPATARTMGVQDISRPAQNIAGGTAYLDYLLKLYNDDIKLALAAYNAGPAAVARYHGIPPFRETQAYVKRVIADFNRRKSQASSTAPATTIASR